MEFGRAVDSVLLACNTCQLLSFHLIASQNMCTWAGEKLSYCTISLFKFKEQTNRSQVPGQAAFANEASKAHTVVQGHCETCDHRSNLLRQSFYLGLLISAQCLALLTASRDTNKKQLTKIHNFVVSIAEARLQNVTKGKSLLHYSFQFTSCCIQCGCYLVRKICSVPRPLGADGRVQHHKERFWKI